MADSLPTATHPRLDRVWFVGCGQMAGALLARWLAAGLPPGQVLVVDPAPHELPPGVVTVPGVAMAGAALPDPTLVVLGIKPQMVAEVGPALALALAGDGPRPILLSMLAGVRTGTLSGLLPGLPVVRIMPNLPARIGRGVTALFAPALSVEDRAAIDWLLAEAGRVVVLEDEQRFDAVTAISGSGPAFLYRFIETLAGAGEAAGLDHDTAAVLALETVAGAAALAAESGVSPTVLRQRVTSPGGTTEAGLDVLDGEGALSTLLRATVRAAAERSRALAAVAEAGAHAALSPREAAKA
ncbi:MAG: pyrroline-5-carboxylate reductase [Sphingomonadaceae bacterium]